MSPRAAWRLETLGLGPVYDYVGGKVDWLAAGLTTQGPGAGGRRVIDATDRHPPTCHVEDDLSKVVLNLERLGVGQCVVVNDVGIVQGQLRTDRLSEQLQGVVGAVMEPGPTTIRPHEPLTDTLDRMTRRHAASLIVTTPEGTLIGLLRR